MKHLRTRTTIALISVILATACTEPSEPVASLRLTPAADTLAPGATLVLSAIPLGTVGNELHGRTVAWSTSNAAVVTVSQGVLAAGAEGVATITATVEQVSATATITVHATVASVLVAAPADSVVSGRQIQLGATPRDSLNRPLTGAAFLPRAVVWQSLDPARATVSAGGLLHALTAGSVAVTATIEGVVGSDTIRVLIPVASVTVTAPADTVAPGDTVRLVATARDSTGAPVGGRTATWSSSDPTRAIHLGFGAVLGAAEGSALIIATVEGHSDSVALSVRYTVASVSVSSPSSLVMVGDSLQLTATPRDPRQRVIPGRAVAWQSLDATRATVSATGLVHGRALGDVYIVATVEGIAGRDTLRVQSRVASVSVSPARTSVAIGDSVRLAALMSDSIGQQLNDHAAVWSSGTASIASVSQAGYAKGLAQGNVTIYASAGGRVGGANVVVTVGPPAAVAGEWSVSYSIYDYYYGVCAGEASIVFSQAGGTLGGSAAGDGLCYLPAVVTVDNGSVADAAVSFGISSCWFSGSANRVVAPDTIRGFVGCGYNSGDWTAVRSGAAAALSLAPASGGLVIGATQAITAELRDAAGHRLLGRTFDWSSTAPQVATVSAAGVVTAVQPGSASITATFGAIGASASFTITAMPLQAIVAGGHHGCGLTTTGDAYCWGDNGYGELGDGTLQHRVSPVPVAGGRAFGSLAASWITTCGLSSAGAAYCWGINTGDGTNVSRTAPVPVAGGLTFVALAAGDRHVCGITQPGETWCWGDNANGQLGDGTSNVAVSPVRVSGGLTFVSLAAGGDFTCALTVPGAAYCWGRNGAGQLGTGNTTDRLTPAAVAGGRSFASIAAGTSHTCALDGSGAAFCWGLNGRGQLGDGTLGNRNTPTAVAGSNSFAALSAGYEHTCAVAGGAALCWGGNSEGQLGDGSTATRTIPGAVAGGLQLGSVSLGSNLSCGRTTSGIGYCWGSNSSGQLGVGSTTSYTIPVRVLGQP